MLVLSHSDGCSLTPHKKKIRQHTTPKDTRRFAFFMLTVTDIERAQERIRQSQCDSIHVTAVKSFETINQIVSQLVCRDVSVEFKCDHEQPVGSFKIRGALNFVLSSGEDGIKRGFVTHSSGNHGLAVATAARFVGAKAVVVVPEGAPVEKIEKIRAQSSEIVECEATLQAREAACSKLCSDMNMIEIPPFNHLYTMAGQGTMGLEIAEQVPDADVVLAAVGGCGMISGISTALKAKNPRIDVIGVEPSAVDDTIQSLKVGHIRGPSDPMRTTICDALRVNPPGSLCFQIVQKLVTEVISVEDSQVVDAMRLLWKEAGIMTEPSGACATAGLFSRRFIELLKTNSSWRKVVVVICGRNIAENAFQKMIREYIPIVGLCPFRLY